MCWKKSVAALAAAGLAAGAGAAGAAEFELTSPDIPAGGTIDKRFEMRGFGCAGANESPALRWKNAPAGTRSFAVTVYDPDAPTGSGWWHWVLLNVPPAVNELRARAGHVSQVWLPPGAFQVRNDYGYAGWGGVCPPEGARPHRYVFAVYALKADRLDLDRNATPALAGFMIQANMIAKASFVATYGRPAR